MNDYFAGAVPQLLERTQQLCDLIPRNLGRDVAALEVVCRDRLNEIAQRLRAIRDNPEMRQPANQIGRLRLFRRVHSDLDEIESIAVTALCRWNSQDERANRLAEALAREIRYPLPTRFSAREN